MRTKLFTLAILITFVSFASLSYGCRSEVSQEPGWVEIAEGLPHYATTTALAFDFFDNDLLYAAVHYKHSVYRSENGGNTWQLADQGLEGAPVYALVPSPTRPSTIYAGAADGLYISTDAARSWQPISAIPEKQIFSLLIPSGTPDRIYAGSFGRLFVSDDAGANWIEFTRGLEGTTLLSLAIDEKTPGSIFAGTNGGGVLRSTDGGATWNRLYSTGAVVSSVMSGPKEEFILARAEDRLLRSTDGGVHWENFGPLPNGLRPLSMLSGIGQSILAGSDGNGIYSSADGGTSWQHLGDGLARTRVTALAVDRQNPGRVAAGTTHGVFLSDDGGQIWQRGGPIGRPIVRGLVLAPEEGRLIAGTTDGVYELSGGSWHPLGLMPKETQILSFALKPASPQTLYAGTWGASIQKSTDGGQTWQLSAGNQFSETIIPSMLTDPSDPDRLYARVEYDRIIMTGDGGHSWHPADEGLMDVTVQALAAGPSRPGLLYAGTDKGIYRSLNHAATWSRTGEVPWSGSIFNIWVDSRDADQLQVGTTSGIFLSTDGGRTWGLAKGIEDATVSALLFSTVDPKRGFAGTRFQGVYQTDDGGMNWRPFAKGLDDTTVNALVLDEKTRHLFAATEEGVFTIALPGG